VERMTSGWNVTAPPGRHTMWIRPIMYGLGRRWLNSSAPDGILAVSDRALAKITASYVLRMFQ
jgi:hypothetical protein